MELAETQPRGKKLALVDFFSFEFLIIALLYIGRFKKIAFIKSLPIDATLLILLITVIVSIPIMLQWCRYINRSTYLTMAVFTAFVLWIGLSWLWSPGHAYAMKKIILTFGLCLPLYLWGIVIGNNPKRFNRFIKLLFTFTLVYTLLSLIWYFEHYSDHWIKLFGSDPVSISRITALGLLISTYYLFFIKKAHWIWWIVILFAVLLFGYTTLATVKKGAFIAAILVSLFQYVIFLRTSKEKLIIKILPLFALLLLACALLFSILFFNLHDLSPVIFRTVWEYSHWPFQQTSFGVRIMLYVKALHMFAHHFWVGAGIGAFPIYAHSKLNFKYPHNVFLEVAAELGIVGLALLISIIVRPVYAFI